MRLGDHLNDQDYAELYGASEPKEARLTLREFLLLALAAITLGWLGGCDDGAAAEVTASIEAETRACIAQYGPGERWIAEKPLMCARGVSDPRHVFSAPVAQ